MTECKGTINLGLCCIVSELRTCKINNKKTEIFTGRTINNRKYYTVEKAKSKATANVKDLLKLLEYCKTHKINCFRVGSDIFPRMDDPEVENYTIDFAKDDLKIAGDFAKANNIRILQHPCQLVNIASPNISAYENSVKILQHHADILEAMGMDDNSVLIVHGGGVYNNKEKTRETWIQRYHELPSRIKNRLVIENCERAYNIDDCLYISSKTGIPVVYDTHHKECYDLLNPGVIKSTPMEFLPKIIATWGKRIPVMHVSNQKENSRLGAHSDYIYKFPLYLFDFIRIYDGIIHLEVEAKAKECAIFKLREQYPLLK